jgi:polysaccharide pyruvyl transferase WcaK-like protein
MHKLQNPLVLGVQTKPAKQPLSIDKMLMRTGQNTGNMLFSASTSALFDNAVSANYAMAGPRLLEGRDCIVIAAANWLNPNADFGNIAEKLEAANLPIIALGLGAQSTVEKKIPKLKPGSQRFVSLLAERSPSISARGTFSCEVLAHYGAKNAVATGCPSLLMNGKNPPVFRPKSEERSLSGAGVSLHGTRHHFHNTDPFQTHLYREALSNEYDLLLQSELADFYFALNQLDDAEITEKASNLLAQVYQTAEPEFREYLKKHGKVFFGLDEWLEYNSKKTFVIGTRIHGTIAGILAGTPSLLIAHDSRTVELADAMGVPYIMKGSVPIDRPLDIEAYYNTAMAHNFTETHRQYWDGFRDFFDSCSLQTNLYPTAG